MQILRQSTQIIVRVGPFVDVGDGFTPQTDITLGGDEAELLKNASVEVDISGRTWAAITNCRGWYDLTLTTSDTDTVGLLTVVVQDDSDCLPVFRDFQVVEEAVFDELYTIGAVGIENAVWDAVLTGASHNDATSAGKRLRQIAGVNVLRGEEQAQGGSASTITLHTDASSINGYYDDVVVVIVGGTGAGQSRHTHGYVGSTRVASTTPDWITNPDNTSDYILLADSEKHVHEIDSGAVTASITAANWMALLAAVDTDIATSDSTISFTLTAGKASNDAFNGMLIAITDADDSNVETRRIEDYTSGRVVTVDRAFSFTPAVSDVVRIYSPAYDKLVAVAGGSANTYIVTDDGTSGGTPIADVHVWVTVDSAGARLVASGTTDINGEVIFYLDAGTTYYVWMAKNGYNFSDTGESWLAT